MNIIGNLYSLYLIIPDVTHSREIPLFQLVTNDSSRSLLTHKHAQYTVKLCPS